MFIMCGKKAHNAVSPAPIPVVTKPPIIAKPTLPEIKKPVDEEKKQEENMSLIFSSDESKASKASQKPERKQRKYKQQLKQTAEVLGIPNNRRSYLDSLLNEETVEYVHCNLDGAHVFQMPEDDNEDGPKAESFTESLWSGVIKVINRDEFSGFLLLERYHNEIFAVCPLVDVRRVLPREIFPDATPEEMQRFEDCARFFVLTVQKSDAPEGDYGEVAIGFPDRSQARDFNIAMATVNCDAEAMARLRQDGELVVTVSKEEAQYLLDDAGIDINDLKSPHSEETEVMSPPAPEPEPVVEEPPAPVEEEPVVQEEEDEEMDTQLKKGKKNRKYKRKGSRRSEEAEEREVDGVRYVEDKEEAVRDQGGSCFTCFSC